jgi:1-deoxy-D-xylulose-5-phosphate synthase
MPGGTGLLKFKEAYPQRLFDVGIAEEHAVSMAGGLAKQGMVPVVALYSTFLQRAYDQILQDIAMLHLHVVLAVDRAGLVGEDGETHHGVFDVGFLRHAPGMTFLAPASCQELHQMLTWAVKEHDGPVAIRYPRGGDGLYMDSQWDPSLGVVMHRTGKDCAIITYGTLINNCLQAADVLAQQGIDAAVIRLTRLNPLPVDSLNTMLSGVSNVIVVEECGHSSGLFSELNAHIDAKCAVIDLGDAYVPHGSIAELYRCYGLDSGGIIKKVQEVLRYEN